MTAVAIWTLAFLPPFISGPLMALFLAPAASAADRRRRVFFWMLLLSIDAAAFALLAWNLDSELGFGPVSCLMLPFTALASALITTGRGRSLRAALGAADPRWSWYRRTAVAIPFLQLLIIAMLALLGPALCELGWRPCTIW